MKFLAWIVLTAGALLSFMVSFAEGSSETPFHLLGGLLFTLFAVSPYIFLIMRVQRVSKRRVPKAILLLGSVALTAFGLAIYYNAFVVAAARDPQDAILFFMIPTIQWVCALALAGIARLFDRDPRATAQTTSGTEA